jgi:hypothetical protein
VKCTVGDGVPPPPPPSPPPPPGLCASALMLQIIIARKDKMIEIAGQRFMVFTCLSIYRKFPIRLII